MYLGSWAIDNWLSFCANTFTPATGAAVDADALPTYRIYEDETTAPIVTGNMALLDDANTVGWYSERVQLTTGNGFAKGQCYTIRIAGIVGGVTGILQHSLQIEAEVDANTVSDKAGYALADPDLAKADVSALATSAALATAQADLDNPDQYKADVSDLATSAALATAQADLDAPDQYKADVSTLATSAALATAQADLDAPDQYKADVSALATAAALATAQADLDAPDQYKADVSAVALEANVRGHADDALAAYDPPTDAEMDAAFLAQTGADGDTLKTLSDQIDAVATLGPGALPLTYTLTSSVDGTPIAQADVWATTDAGGNVIARGTTSDLGIVTFWLDAWHYYIWRAKSGYEFENPDEEVVS